jgi:hypothetical protein
MIFQATNRLFEPDSIVKPISCKISRDVISKEAHLFFRKDGVIYAMKIKKEFPQIPMQAKVVHGGV